MADWVNVLGPGGRVVSRFDLEKARRWTDQDPFTGNGSGGTGRGTALICTATGSWVIETWSHWQGEVPASYQYVEGDDARAWLLRNGETAVAEELFGEVPEEEPRRAGRPQIGNEITAPIGDLLPRLAASQERHGDESRAAAVRRLLAAALDAEGS
jgi:hypothetical protein